jgi:hypothetical protein
MGLSCLIDRAFQGRAVPEEEAVKKPHDLIVSCDEQLGKGNNRSDELRGG